jgi:twinkle protein
MEIQESEFVEHGPCSACGSSDGLAHYTDGHTYCFVCQAHTKADGAVDEKPKTIPKDFVFGVFQELKKRGINEKTCRKFGYMVGTRHGVPVQIAPYHDATGNLCGQKLRTPDKDFTWTGEPKSAVLFGQQLWRDKGKMVVVTEGEIDAMSISQLQDNRWPVVSLRNGASGAKKDIAKSIEWLEGFESVVLAFDMDEPGAKAAGECAPLLTPGKARIWNIPLKDANEMLVAGRSKELLDAIWGAKVYRPDGIVEGASTWDILVREDVGGALDYPWPGLQAMLLGLRQHEIVTFCAGSGMGKSQVCRELAVHAIKQGQTVGYIALEESVQRSIRGLVSIVVNAPLHLPRARKKFTEGSLEKMAELKAGWDVVSNKAFFYDHWGSLDGENLFQRIRYLVHACGCEWIVLDHLSIMVSGDEEGDERRKIDNLMTKLRSLVEQLPFGLVLVSHLKRPDGRPLEEGGKTHLGLLRGSASIGQLSDIVVGQERNQQDEERKNITLLRVLKNRFSGETGEAGELIYNPETGRLFSPGEEAFTNGGSNTSDY